MAKALDQDREAFAKAIYEAETAGYETVWVKWNRLVGFQKRKYRNMAKVMIEAGYGKQAKESSEP